MTIQADLLAEIEAFLPVRKITATTFGRLAVNDGKFVGRLRNSENMTLATLERARQFIERERFAANDVAGAAESRVASL